MGPPTDRLADRPLLLTRAEAAQLLSMSVDTFDRLVIRGLFTRLNPAGGRSVRFERRELELWVERGCKPPLPRTRRRQSHG